MELKRNKIISAVRTDSEFRAALEAPPMCIFLLNADLLSLGKEFRAAHACGKRVFVHMDLARGVGKDKEGVQVLKSIGADGMISTRTSLLKQAKECGLHTVLRVFIMDSHAGDIAVQAAKTAGADMLEIMPGIVPKMITRISSQVQVPVIAGGLIETPEEVMTALGAGASAISSGIRRCGSFPQWEKK